LERVENANILKTCMIGLVFRIHTFRQLLVAIRPTYRGSNVFSDSP